MIVQLADLALTSSRHRYCRCCRRYLKPYVASAGHTYGLDCEFNPYVPRGVTFSRDRWNPGRRWEYVCEGDNDTTDWCWTPEKGYYAQS